MGLYPRVISFYYHLKQELTAEAESKPLDEARYWANTMCILSLRNLLTNDTQAVTHPSTNRAQRCLTSVIGRETLRPMFHCLLCHSTEGSTCIASTLYSRLSANNRQVPAMITAERM